MSDATDTDIDGGDDSGTEPGTDSNATKALRALVAKQNKQLADQQKLIDDAAKAGRATTVADLFESRGVSKKLASFYTDDDVSPDALNKWLEDNAETFNLDLGSDDGDAEQRTAAEAVSRVAAAAPPAKTGPLADLQKLQSGNPRSAADYQALVEAGLVPAIEF